MSKKIKCNGSMDKTKLIKEIHNRTDVHKIDVMTVINMFIEVSREQLTAGNKISMRGYGTVYVKKRHRIIARNIHTMEEIIIPEVNMVAFKTGFSLLQKLNKGLVYHGRKRNK